MVPPQERGPYLVPGWPMWARVRRQVQLTQAPDLKAALPQLAAASERQPAGASLPGVALLSSDRRSPCALGIPGAQQKPGDHQEEEWGFRR